MLVNEFLVEVEDGAFSDEQIKRDFWRLVVDCHCDNVDVDSAFAGIKKFRSGIIGGLRTDYDNVKGFYISVTDFAYPDEDVERDYWELKVSLDGNSDAFGAALAFVREAVTRGQRPQIDITRFEESDPEE